jgi:hypothetical protein
MVGVSGKRLWAAQETPFQVVTVKISFDSQFQEKSLALARAANYINFDNTCQEHVMWG